MRAHQLKKSTGLKKRANRLGRGDGSKGNTSGKGNKGQKARSGFSVVPFFEGGQTPIVQRLPKRKGFKRYYKLVEHYVTININKLERNEKIKSGDKINKKKLKELGYLKSEQESVKILGTGELKKNLEFIDIDVYSVSAKEKIKKAGGQISKK